MATVLRGENGAKRAPEWSLAGLRALVGLACIEAPDALAALLDPRRRTAAPTSCDLLFLGVGAALASPSWRTGLDGLLASLLARQAEPLTRHSLYELAAQYANSREPLSPRSRLALLWLLGRHPCSAARRLEERVARDLGHSSSGNGPS